MIIFSDFIPQFKFGAVVVPQGEELDPQYKTQTQLVTYRDNKRIGCKILDVDGKELKTVNTAMLD